VYLAIKYSDSATDWNQKVFDEVISSIESAKERIFEVMRRLDVKKPNFPNDKVAAIRKYFEY